MIRLSETCQVELGPPLPDLPRWTPDYLTIGPHGSPSEYDKFLATTVGFGDPLLGLLNAVRFTADQRLLAGLQIKMPERPQEAEELSLGLSGAQVESGILRLSDPPRATRLTEPDFVFMHAERDQLICWSGIADGSTLHVLRVAQDLNYFWSDDLDGWMLSRPANYLSHFWGDPTDNLVGDDLRRCAEEYVLLVSDEFVVGLENAEPGAQTALIGLFGRISRCSHSPQRQVLQEKILDMADIFSIELPRSLE
jgi:hypothetical protein